ncbi:MAG: hypothetical protein A4E23_00153 [Methanomethylovorans sp. PtaU1.Bin073]|nr:MAG: hypothetical protein A4E23_00153 [Methanomethylovorans sp. PtaU1.Bin073]
MTVTPTKRETIKHMTIPMSRSFPKSCIIGTADVNREKKPRAVMIRAISTAGPMCLIVCTTASAASSPFASSSSMRLWNWIA